MISTKGLNFKYNEQASFKTNMKLTIAHFLLLKLAGVTNFSNFKPKSKKIAGRKRGHHVVKHF